MTNSKIMHGYDRLNKDMFFSNLRMTAEPEDRQSIFSNMPLQITYKKIQFLPDGST